MTFIEKTEFARAGLSLEDVDDENSQVLHEEGFASMITLNGLSVTIRSTMDIVRKLHAAGFPYVLTGKLNQDAIEVGVGLEFYILIILRLMLTPETNEICQFFSVFLELFDPVAGTMINRPCQLSYNSFEC